MTIKQFPYIGDNTVQSTHDVLWCFLKGNLEIPGPRNPRSGIARSDSSPHAGGTDVLYTRCCKVGLMFLKMPFRSSTFLFGGDSAPNSCYASWCSRTGQPGARTPNTKHDRNRPVCGRISSRAAGGECDGPLVPGKTNLGRSSAGTRCNLHSSAPRS